MRTKADRKGKDVAGGRRSHDLAALNELAYRSATSKNTQIVNEKYARACMLQRLPSHWIPDNVEAPTAQPRQMNVSGAIVNVQRAANEALPAILCVLPEAR